MEEGVAEMKRKTAMLHLRVEIELLFVSLNRECNWMMHLLLFVYKSKISQFI